MSAQSAVRLSQTSPAFLHSNSTSHVWTFAAIAELIDNAYDPDVKASELSIDKKTIKGHEALVFTDNGAGMDPDKLFKMLSFGYCNKQEVRGHKPIGHYGNGFKSGAMRLAKDAIIFTKHKTFHGTTGSVGLLSQTYLANIYAETVRVPIVSWNFETEEIIQKADSKASLDAFIKHSLFSSEYNLRMEFHALDNVKSGTKIVLYNLKRHNDGLLELDFQSDTTDILDSEYSMLDCSLMERPLREDCAKHLHSLRAYCAILYLKPRMKIFLRGTKVRTKMISKSLLRTEKDFYKPAWLERSIKLTLGFAKQNDDFGVNLYHKNRLIRAHEKVGYQIKMNELGTGVVCVLEVDCLQPTHDKQNFVKNDKYIGLMGAVSRKLNDYWDAKNGTPIQESDVHWTWVQCDQCLAWRKLVDGTTESQLPEKWFCRMNRDQTHNRCGIPEELEDEDDYSKRATYQKRKPKPRMERYSTAELRKGINLVDKILNKQKDFELQQKRIMDKLSEPNKRLEAGSLATCSKSDAVVGQNISKYHGKKAMKVSMFAKEKRKASAIKANQEAVLTTSHNDHEMEEEINDNQNDAIGAASEKDDGHSPAKKKRTEHTVVVDAAVNNSARLIQDAKTENENLDKTKSGSKRHLIKTSNNKCHGCAEREKELQRVNAILNKLRIGIRELVTKIMPDIDCDVDEVDQVVDDMVASVSDDNQDKTDNEDTHISENSTNALNNGDRMTQYETASVFVEMTHLEKNDSPNVLDENANQYVDAKAKEYILIDDSCSVKDMISDCIDNSPAFELEYDYS